VGAPRRGPEPEERGDRRAEARDDDPDEEPQRHHDPVIGTNGRWGKGNVRISIAPKALETDAFRSACPRAGRAPRQIVVVLDNH
jgi:hypothetical protein